MPVYSEALAHLLQKKLLQTLNPRREGRVLAQLLMEASKAASNNGFGRRADVDEFLALKYYF